MKIAHTGDTHIAVRHKRWLTLDRALRDMTTQMKEARPDLIVHAGDLGEPNPTAQDLYSQAVFLQELADIAPTIVVAGNHDSISHLEVLARIETFYPLWISTGPDTLAFMGGDLRHLGDLDLADIEAVQCVIHTMPWPAKGNLLSILPQMPSSDESDQVAQQLLLDIFRGFKAERESAGCSPDVPAIMVGHLEVHGATMDSGQPALGPGMRVGVYDLGAAACDVVMLGHIHARQGLEIEPGLLAYYSGSPCRLTWGEAGDLGKGWALHHITEELDHEWVNVPSPQLWTTEAEWVQVPEGQPSIGGWDFDFGEQKDGLEGVCPEDELRIRYTVPEDQREPAKAEILRCASNLSETIPRERITIEEVVLPTDKARAPEIARLDDPSQMFDRWIAAEGHDLPEERRARLQLLMNQVLQEVTP